MILANDSYMGIFMPIDIQNRILQFMDEKLTFPFIRGDEIVGVFFSSAETARYQMRSIF